MRNSFLFVLVAVIFTELFFLMAVHAAGGGGDPLPPPPSAPSPSPVAYSGGGSTSPFSAVTCYTDGSITFEMSQPMDIISSNTHTGESFSVPGSWNLGMFTSDEGIFKEGTYNITDRNKITRAFTCPQIQRVCKWIQLVNASCIQNSSGIVARINIINESNGTTLKFNFKRGNTLFSATTQERNLELKDLHITQDESSFILTLNHSLDVDTFEVVHTACLGKRYLYIQVPCTSSVSSTSILASPLPSAEKSKCGGLLDIQDRVRCRVNLQSGFNDYENFYPEECKTHVDGDACYTLYKSVSPCWKEYTSKERIACLQKTLETNSKQSPREKILTLTKLRLYNLEEQAETLEQYGLLNKEDMIMFTVAIELKKKEFNTATTTTDRKKVIQDARALWQELMKKVSTS